MKNSAFFVLFMAFLLAGCSKSQPSAPQSAGPDQPPAVHVDTATAGSIDGTISFKGAVPKFKSIDMTDDPGCPSQPQQPDTVVVKEGRLANVFVYIKEGLPQGSFSAPSQPVVLDQKGCRYSPHVLGLMTGQPLRIVNSDNTEHNIHSMSQNNAPFNESQMPQGDPVMKTFDHQEMTVVVQCNQHPWMKAYVNVMSNPYFAVSDNNGNFHIANLPPGEYTLAAVHEKFGEQTMKLTVAPKSSAKADFTFGK